MAKPERKVYTFRSSSLKFKTYETIWNFDGDLRNYFYTLTCNCPGWTRRVQPDGSRMCVHTRLIQSGNPEKDPLFVSCVPPLKPPLPSFAYPEQNYMPVENMGAENFAPITVRRRAVYFNRISVPTSYSPYFRRVGQCRYCNNYHFPEYENCTAGWPQKVVNGVTVKVGIKGTLLRMPSPQVVKIQAPRDPEPITKPQRRKFNFDE